MPKMRQHETGKATERHCDACDGFEKFPTDHARRLRQTAMRHRRLYVQRLISGKPPFTPFLGRLRNLEGLHPQAHGNRSGRSFTIQKMPALRTIGVGFPPKPAHRTLPFHPEEIVGTSGITSCCEAPKLRWIVFSAGGQKPGETPVCIGRLAGHHHPSKCFQKS